MTSLIPMLCGIGPKMQLTEKLRQPTSQERIAIFRFTHVLTCLNVLQVCKVQNSFDISSPTHVRLKKGAQQLWDDGVLEDYGEDIPASQPE